MTQIALPVQVVVSEILAIEEVKDVISLYPNPSQGSLNIDSKFPISEISILDQTGKLMMNFHHVQKSIDVSALDKGLYFLKIDNEQVIKFIKR